MDNKKTIERRKKVLFGTVVSARMEKSAVVKVQRTIQHPLYKRTMKQTKKIQNS
jgi:small subunit ribosomal protein S17